VTGTVSEWAPDRVIIRERDVTDPESYYFSKRVEYVDEAGNPVARELIAPGAPVTMRYVREGDRMFVDRVVVQRRVAPVAVEGRTVVSETAAPLEVAGTVSEWGPDRVIIRERDVANPVPFYFSKKLVYVDEAGNPVERQVIAPGAPVTVHYTREGDRMLADRVVVRRTVAPARTVTTEVAPSRAVTTEATTTTTTTVSGREAKEIEKLRAKIAHDERELAEHPDRTRLQDDLARDRAALEAIEGRR
jgi:hypothetical protein